MREKTYFHLCRVLNEEMLLPVWPAGTALGNFQPDMAGSVYTLLSNAYTVTSPMLAPFDEWWAALSGDSEYDGKLIFPVSDTTGQIIAFAQCWSSGFIKDIVVHPSWRKQRIGEALLLHCFYIFKMRGVDKVCLKVEQANGFGAEQLYRRLGMTDT